MKVERVDKVIQKLRKQKRNKLGQYGKNVSVTVGYTAEYAIYVHENLEANHPNGGQAKYLEQPAREHSSDIAGIVHNGIRSGLTLEQALVTGGLFLQRESQKLVPVDTGNLKGSAFTKLDRA